VAVGFILLLALSLVILTFILEVTYISSDGHYPPVTLSIPVGRPNIIMILLLVLILLYIYLILKGRLELGSLDIDSFILYRSSENGVVYLKLYLQLWKHTYNQYVYCMVL